MDKTEVFSVSMLMVSLCSMMKTSKNSTLDLFIYFKKKFFFQKLSCKIQRFCGCLRYFAVSVQISHNKVVKIYVCYEH